MGVTGRLKQRYIATRVAHDHARAESTFVKVDGADLHFVIKGAGRAVVLIHGNPGSCQDWSRLYVPISESYRAFAFDRPGHGHSQRPNHRDITVEVQAEMLHAALAQLDVLAAFAETARLSFPGRSSFPLQPASSPGPVDHRDARTRDASPPRHRA